MQIIFGETEMLRNVSLMILISMDIARVMTQGIPVYLPVKMPLRRISIPVLIA